jgi:hypothetical protein
MKTARIVYVWPANARGGGSTARVMVLDATTFATPQPTQGVRL